MKIKLTNIMLVVINNIKLMKSLSEIDGNDKNDFDNIILSKKFLNYNDGLFLCRHKVSLEYPINFNVLSSFKQKQILLSQYEYCHVDNQNSNFWHKQSFC